MGDPPTPQLDPALVEQQRQAKADRIEAIRDRVGGDTRDLLVQFGRRKAFSGTGDLGGGLGNLPGIAGGARTPDIGLFQGKKLELLRGLGRL